MNRIVIPDIDEDLIQRLGQRAASHGRSVESEAKAIIVDAVRPEHSGVWEAVDRIRERLSATGRSFGDSVDIVREDRQR